MTLKAWAILQGQIVQDRAHYDWYAKHPSCQNPGGTLRHIGRVAAYGDLLDGIDRLVRRGDAADADIWTEFRADVKRDRDLFNEQAAEHGEMTGHEAQEERAYGRVEAYDEVLAYMDSAEKAAGR